jgi:hypothetical protein
MKKNLVPLLFILALILNYLFLSLLPNNISMSPDENAKIYFNTLIGNEGSLMKLINNGESYNHLLHPRNSINLGGHIVPQTFLGNNIIEGVITIFANSAATLILNIIVLILFCIYSYKLFRLFKNPRTSIIIVLLVLVLSPFVNLLNITASLMMILFYYFYRYLEKNEIKYLILMFLMYCVCSILRYEYLVLLILLIIYALLHKNNNKKIQSFLIFFVIIAIYFSLILLLNNILYGNPFLVGYNFDPQAHDTKFYAAKSISNKIISYLLPYGINLTSIYDKSLRYIFILFPTSIISIFLIFIKYTKDKESKSRNFFFVFLSTFVLFIIYYCSNPHFYNYGITTMNSSYVRYLSFFILFLLLLLSSIRISNKKTSILITFLLLSISIIMASMAYIDTSKRLNEYADIKDNLLNLTDTNSIIFTYYWDKIMWPDRLVATSSFNITSEDQIIECIFKMDKDGYKIYILPDSLFYNNISKSNKLVLQDMGYLGLNKVSIKN